MTNAPTKATELVPAGIAIAAIKNMQGTMTPTMVPVQKAILNALDLSYDLYFLVVLLMLPRKIHEGL